MPGLNGDMNNRTNNKQEVIAVDDKTLDDKRRNENINRMKVSEQSRMLSKVLNMQEKILDNWVETPEFTAK